MPPPLFLLNRLGGSLGGIQVQKILVSGWLIRPLLEFKHHGVGLEGNQAVELVFGQFDTA